MKNLPIDWDSVPDVMNKDQFYRLCHISKSTALHLLKSGKVPCEWTGKKTRCYKIKKEDVRAYLEERAVYPELYSAPRGWYGDHYVAKLSKELPEDVLRQMHGYYAKLLSKYKDILGKRLVILFALFAFSPVFLIICCIRLLFLCKLSYSSLQGFLCILGVLSLREFQYAKNQLTGKRFFRFLF